MKAWKLVSLLLAIALVVAVVFCVTLNNSQKLAGDEFAKVKADLDAAQATIAEKEKALTDADALSKAALDQAAADKDAAVAEAVAEYEAKLSAALNEKQTALDEAAEKDELLADAQATIETLEQQLAALTPTPSPTPEPTSTPAPAATVAP